MGPAELITNGDKADNIALATLTPFAVVGAVLLAVGVRWVYINRTVLADAALDAIAGVDLPALPHRAVNARYVPMHRLVDDQTPRPWRVGVQPPVGDRGRHWAVGELHDTGMFPTITPKAEDGGQQDAEVTA